MKDQLTHREKEILALIVNEYSSLDIAAALNLSIRTIDTHRKNILRKTNTKTLIGLFKFAIKEGMIEDYYYKPTILNPGRKYT